VPADVTGSAALNEPLCLVFAWLRALRALWALAVHLSLKARRGEGALPSALCRHLSATRLCQFSKSARGKLLRWPPCQQKEPNRPWAAAGLSYPISQAFRVPFQGAAFRRRFLSELWEFGVGARLHSVCVTLSQAPEVSPRRSAPCHVSRRGAAHTRVPQLSVRGHRSAALRRAGAWSCARGRSPASAVGTGER